MSDNATKRPLRICPIDNCGTVTKNIGEHLRSKKHGLSNKGPTKDQYLMYMKEAGFFDQMQLPRQTEFSPKKHLGVVSKSTLKSKQFAKTALSTNSSTTQPSNLSIDPSRTEHFIVNEQR